MRPRWQVERAAHGHADDWLMTYADMITLLLCFFAVFLTVAVPKKIMPHKVELARSIVVPAEPVHFLEGDLPFHGLPSADRPTEDYVPAGAVAAKPEPLAAPPDAAGAQAERPP